MENFTNYYGEDFNFEIRNEVTHVTDDGDMITGKISDIHDSLLEIIFDNGLQGWEWSYTCF